MQEDDICSFENHTSDFGLDSCSTTHVCENLELFVSGTIREVPNLGIDGIERTQAVAKLGSIQLEIMDNFVERKTMLLNNMAHIPRCSNNLI